MEAKDPMGVRACLAEFHTPRPTVVKDSHGELSLRYDDVPDADALVKAAENMGVAAVKL